VKLDAFRIGVRAQHVNQTFSSRLGSGETPGFFPGELLVCAGYLGAVQAECRDPTGSEGQSWKGKLEDIGDRPRVVRSPGTINQPAAGLGQDLEDRLDVFHTDEFLVETAKEVGEPVGIEAKAVQHRGVEALHMKARFVAVAMARPR
jgi:hypothetical protein